MNVVRLGKLLSISISILCTLNSVKLHASGNSNSTGNDDSSHYVKLAMIKPDERVQGDFVKQAGESAVFSGELCFSNSNYHSKRNNCDWLVNPNFELHAYYPDPTTEVTEDMDFDLTPENGNSRRHDKKNYKSLSGYYKDFRYEYVTPELVSDDTNSFTLIIGTVEKKCEQLLNVRGKFKKRLQRFYSLLENRDKIKGKGREKLQKLISILESANENINETIDKQPGVLARIEQPGSR